MKRRHHLEWHRFRKNKGILDWRRRGDRFHSLKLVVTGTIGSASATFVDPLNGSLMGNPSLMEVVSRSRTSAKVLVEPLNDPVHDLLEAGQLIFEVLHRIVKNVQLGGLLTNHLAKLASLTWT